MSAPMNMLSARQCLVHDGFMNQSADGQCLAALSERQCADELHKHSDLVVVRLLLKFSQTVIYKPEAVLMSPSMTASQIS